MLRIITIAAVILPLAIDTFVLGTALGAAGIAKRARLRTSLTLTAFEAGMPVIGFVAGSGIGLVIGRWADYIAAAVLAMTGLLMIRPQGADEDDERKVGLLDSTRGWAVVLLGLSISVDELAIGFGVGLLRLPLLLLVALIAAQAFLAAQIGMRFGAGLADNSRRSAGRLAGALLLLAAVLVVIERFAPA